MSKIKDKLLPKGPGPTPSEVCFTGGARREMKGEI